MGEYQLAQDAEGLKPTKYTLGKLEDDGHTHIIFLRDDLPIATTSSNYHAHSIKEGVDNTLVCIPILDHTHTTLVVEQAGDYLVRTMIE